MECAPRGNDVVGGDHALIAQTEATSQIEAAGQAAKVAGGVGGEAGKALVVVGAEAGEHGISFCQSGGASEPEFADQTILASLSAVSEAPISREIV